MRAARSSSPSALPFRGTPPGHGHVHVLRARARLGLRGLGSVHTDSYNSWKISLREVARARASPRAHRLRPRRERPRPHRPARLRQGPRRVRRRMALHDCRRRRRAPACIDTAYCVGPGAHVVDRAVAEALAVVAFTLEDTPKASVLKGLYEAISQLHESVQMVLEESITARAMSNIRHAVTCDSPAWQNKQTKNVAGKRKRKR